MYYAIMTNYNNKDEILSTREYSDNSFMYWALYSDVVKGFASPLKIPEDGVLGKHDKVSLWTNYRIKCLSEEEYKIWAVKQRLIESNK